jgi:hypothetical protein
MLVSNKTKVKSNTSKDVSQMKRNGFPVILEREIKLNHRMTKITTNEPSNDYGSCKVVEKSNPVHI